MAALAPQVRIGVGKEVSRYQGGLVGKLWVEQAKLLFLGEADFIRQQVSAANYGQNQFVSYLGATLFPIQGIMLGARVRALPGEPGRQGDRAQRLPRAAERLPVCPLRAGVACSAT